MIARWENLETTCEYFSKCRSFAKRGDVKLEELDNLFSCYSGGDGCLVKEIYQSIELTQQINSGVKSW